MTKSVLGGLYVASGDEEARIAILPGSKIVDAWERDELVRRMLLICVDELLHDVGTPN